MSTAQRLEKQNCPSAVHLPINYQFRKRLLAEVYIVLCSGLQRAKEQVKLGPAACRCLANMTRSSSFSASSIMCISALEFGLSCDINLILNEGSSVFKWFVFVFPSQALGMTSSQDRAVVKKKLKEMKVSLEKARKAQEKMEKQREKLRRKEQEQMQRKSKKTEKMAAATEGAGEQ